MKINDTAAKHTAGSFGIPEEMKQAAERNKAKARPEPKVEAPVKEVEESEEKPDASKTPYDILRSMGADFTEDDFQKLIFKGTYETTLDVVKGRLTAKFRTLSTRDHDEIDEILAKEMKDIPMTEDGLRSRTSMMIISYGVTEISGKPLTKTILTDDKKPDNKAMAMARRAVFLEMSPSVVNILIQKHGSITVAVNMIASNPEENLKNS